jgi:hypothetical protein
MSQPQSLSVRRRVLLALLALGFALVGAVVPQWADAAHYQNGAAVDGVQQAYHPARADFSATGGSLSSGFFFHGQKPTPTFDENAPTGSTQITQPASGLADNDIPGDPLAAYWEGSFTGDLDGALNLRWFWSGPFGGLIRIDSVVTVFADATADGSTPQPDKVIGRANVSFSVSPNPSAPQENITVVPVEGTVQNKLLIQVVPQLSDASTALNTSYDTQQLQAGFQVLQDGELPQALKSTPAKYDGKPFRVQVANVGRDSAEPTIGINKDGTAFYAAGAFDALPAGSPRQLARTELLRSRDGGLTWKSIQPPVAGQTTDPPTTLDPFVWLDEDTGRVFNPELYAACTSMHYSDNEGESYQTNRAACGEPVNDHQTVFTGPPPPNLKDRMGDYPNVLYYCFNRVADANCGRSLDGGATFDTATGAGGGISYPGFDLDAGGLCGSLHGHGDTDSQGRVFIPKGHCGYPWVSISEDGAETFKRVKVSNSIGAASTHLAVATDAADNVYMVWWDPQEHLPYLAISRDHGENWDAPLMIAPPGVKEVNFPVVEAGDAGRVAVNFPGTTVGDQEDKTRPWNQYIVASTNALAKNPLFVSTTANPVSDPIHRGDCVGRCAGMFDFLDIQISPHDGAIWATATDTCTNDPANEPGDETVDCIHNKGADGNSAAGAGVASDEEGLAIRQLSGPKVSTDVQDTSGGRGGGDGGGDSGVGDTGGETGPGSLPATGGGLGLLLLGAAAMPAAVWLGRRRR